jgi:hypothetical protein
MVSNSTHPEPLDEFERVPLAATSLLGSKGKFDIIAAVRLEGSVAETGATPERAANGAFYGEE